LAFFKNVLHHLQAMNSIINITCPSDSGFSVREDLASYRLIYVSIVLFILMFIPVTLQAQDSLPEECEVVGLQVICTYDTSDTFTVPDGITEITVEAWAAGGGGGALDNHGQGGGGGGAYVQSVVTVVPSSAYTVQVGTGGAPGLPGGDSYFDSELILVARGGLNAVESTGGIGGSADLSLGDIRFSGGNGGDGIVGGGRPNSRGGGGGGGSAYPDANGNDGTDGGSNIAGEGGTGSGDGGDGGLGGENGTNGALPGGGGGGTGAGGVSGSGAGGRIIITYDLLIDTFYSRLSGEWHQAGSWTFDENHTGPAADRQPAELDTVIVGASHIINLTDDVLNDAEIQILDTGTLSTGSFTVSGSGMFSLLPGGTLEIGSAEGITSTDDAGNIRSDVRSFSTGANYVYSGTSIQFTGDGLPQVVNNLTIDNIEGVISETEISRTVNGTLTLAGGVLTMAPGTSLVTRTGGINALGGGIVRMQQVIDGNEGYRMISSPVVTTYADLLDGFVTQGIGGSDWPTRQPNLLYFLETHADSGTTANQSWRTIGSLTDDVSDGRGYFFYVFGDIPEDPDYSDPLPKMMSASGIEPEFSGPGGTYGFDVSYTPTRESTAYLEGWNLVGNPTTATIDWDSNEWNRSNIDETIYVWDTTANGGVGDYVVWNGVTGNLPDEGLIAPFQSFWVKASGENPAMSITDQVKTTGGTFVNDPSLVADMNREEHIAVNLNLSAGNLEGSIFLSFSEDGRTGKDPMDAYRLQPMSGSTFLTFFTFGGALDDAPLQINNLPRDLNQMMHIPLQVGGQMKGEPISDDYTLEWSIPANWPQDWTITLMDHRQQQAISMRNRDQYTFRHEPRGIVQLRSSVESGSAGANMKIPAQLIEPAGIVSPEASQLRMRTNAEESRFTILIEPGGDTNSTEYIPNKPRLMQNYPNPFNSATNIRMVLPDQSDVVLEVYDMIGRRVATLADGSYPAGTHNFSWDASGVASGMYIYRLRTGQKAMTKKMLLVK
jgi:hypothetical protein